MWNESVSDLLLFGSANMNTFWLFQPNNQTAEGEIKNKQTKKRVKLLLIIKVLLQKEVGGHVLVLLTGKEGLYNESLWKAQFF